MRRYMLFVFDYHETQGGMDDFVHSFSSMDEIDLEYPLPRKGTMYFDFHNRHHYQVFDRETNMKYDWNGEIWNASHDYTNQ